MKTSPVITENELRREWGFIVTRKNEFPKEDGWMTIYDLMGMEKENLTDARSYAALRTRLLAAVADGILETGKAHRPDASGRIREMRVYRKKKKAK